VVTVVVQILFTIPEKLGYNTCTSIHYVWTRNV